MCNNTTRPLRWYLLPALMLFVMTVTVFAQAPGTGAITGTLADPSGAVVTRAEVRVVNQKTSLSRVVTTSNGGLFRAALLPPGDYRIEVHVPGFAPKVVRPLYVSVSENTVVNIRLEVDPAATEIRVTGTSELAQTQTSALGRVTDERTLNALPLANRNFSQILALFPGVLVELPSAGALGHNTQNVSANGAKTTSNNFEFNGVDANNISENSASGFDPEVGIAIPAPDTIAEFKVQTGMYDAGYGRGAGANVDLVSKSGSNAFHGSAWEFFRNDALNANDFFVKRAGGPRPVLKQNQFGGAIGGPIRKDKTFFFGSYQATIQRNGVSSSSLQNPILPALTNDRSAGGLGAAFCPANHPNDPFYQTGFGGTQVACTGLNISPVALALLNSRFPNGSYAIPTPQTVGPDGFGGFTGRSSFSIPAQYREDQFTANLDQNFSDRNQLSGRFFYARAPVTEPFSPFGSNVPGWGLQQTERNHSFVLSDTEILHPNLINVARFGFMRFNGFQVGDEPINAADVGMATPAGLPEIPGISVLGAFTIGPSGGPFYFENTNTFIWQDTVSWTHGRHSLRFGGEAKRHQLDVNVPFVKDGFLFFFSFADFLLGQDGTQNGSGISNIFSSTGSSGLFRKDERYTDWAGFIQDDIRVTPRLTLNAGLRYEYFGPANEINGRLPNFDPTIAAHQVPAAGSFSGFFLPSNYSGVLPSGFQKSDTSSMWNSDYKDFSPRLGFALLLRNKPDLVLRGGYGIYYQRLSGELVQQVLGAPPFSFTQTLSGAQNSAASFQQPYVPALPPDSSFPVFIPRTPGSALSVAAISRSTRSPYTQEYDLNLQAELAHDLLWQVGYVGSKATHLTGCVEFNQALVATPQHPVNGQTTTTLDNLSDRLPFAGLAAGRSYICQTTFGSNYNSLQTSLTKRFSHGLDFLAAYTWSKNLGYTSGTGGLSSLDLNFLSNDQTNPRQAYGLNDFDRKHRFVLSFVYEPPQFHTGPKVAQQVLSHWQFSGEAVLQSGLPITVIDSGAGTAFGNLTGFTRAECTGANPASSGSTGQRLDGYFNSAAFTAAPVIGDDGLATGFGNCGVGILRGPDQRNLDLGIGRSFLITEGSALQFRAEFFNFTNTPKFAQPVNDFAAGPAFGVISSTVSNPRVIQFALKYNF
jgi:hypothetical protein